MSAWSPHQDDSSWQRSKKRRGQRLQSLLLSIYLLVFIFMWTPLDNVHMYVCIYNKATTVKKCLTYFYKRAQDIAGNLSIPTKIGSIKIRAAKRCIKAHSTYFCVSSLRNCKCIGFLWSLFWRYALVCIRLRLCSRFDDRENNCVTVDLTALHACSLLF